MAQTVAQAADKVIARLRRLQRVPNLVIAAAHAQLQALVPVYTGTYADAIEFDPSNEPVSSRVYVSMDTLLKSARLHSDQIDDPSFYVTARAVPPKAEKHFELEDGSRPYIERLEEIGSPIYDGGMNLWHDVGMMARQAFDKHFREAVR